MGSPAAKSREPLPIRRPGRMPSVSCDHLPWSATRRNAMDIATVKQRQQAAWAAGDYAAVGARFPITAELLCEAVDLRAGERVLDVACGNGNAALAAARRFCRV